MLALNSAEVVSVTWGAGGIDCCEIFQSGAASDGTIRGMDRTLRGAERTFCGRKQCFRGRIERFRGLIGNAGVLEEGFHQVKDANGRRPAARFVPERSLLAIRRRLYGNSRGGRRQTEPWRCRYRYRRGLPRFRCYHDWRVCPITHT